MAWHYIWDYHTLKTCQNFLWNKRYRICWKNAIFCHKFWRQEIDKESPLLGTYLEIKKLRKIFFFPMVFQARKLVEPIQLFFHCCYHTSEENTAFKMISWSRKTSKKQKFKYISYCNKQIKKLNFSYNFYDAKDGGISTFGWIFVTALKNLQKIKKYTINKAKS